MSHKIGNKSFKRSILIDALLTLIENPDVDTMALQEELEKKFAPLTRTVKSTCPMCRRVYFEGDALCNCAPQVVEKPGPDGKPVKVMRVVGMTNRHKLRAQLCDTARLIRKEKNATRWQNIFEARAGIAHQSRAEWTRRSMKAARERRALLEANNRKRRDGRKNAAA